MRLSRLLTGICIGLIGFILILFASSRSYWEFVFGVDLSLVSPVFFIIGLFGMIFGPLYYWVIEVLRERDKSPP